MLDVGHLRHFRERRSRIRFFVLAVFIIVALGALLFCFDKFAWHEQDLFLSMCKEVLINLIASFITAVVLVAIVFIFMPKEVQEPYVATLDRGQTKKEHDKALHNTKFWKHNGHLGRWVRTDVMPLLADLAKTGSYETFAHLIIMNPKNDALCRRYYEHRSIMQFQEPYVSSVEDVKAELLATVVKACIHHNDRNLFSAKIFFKNQFSLLREDGNEYAVFRTQIDPRMSSLVFYNRKDQHSDIQFYNVSLTNFDNISKQAVSLNLDHEIPQSWSSVITNESLRAFLITLDLLVIDSDAFIENVKGRLNSRFNPHR